jgi:hypothetical protein
MPTIGKDIAFPLVLHYHPLRRKRRKNERGRKFHKSLPEEHHDASLFGEAGKDVLVPFPAEQMHTWPVSQRLNSPKNNDAEIIAPGGILESKRHCFVGKSCSPACGRLRQISI